MPSDKKRKSENTNVTATPSDPMEAIVKVTVELPARLVIAVVSKRAEQTGIEIDVKRLAETPAALKHTVMYGLGRFTRDGAPDSEPIDTGEKDAEGKAVFREATLEEYDTQLVEWSRAKWARLFDGKLRARDAVSGDPILGELRTITIGYLRKQGLKLEAIGKLADRAAVQKILAPYAGIFEKALARATAISEAKTAEL